ncbi:MAG: hypothetical protein JO001_01265 [Alphaproteobacteria bacterium]|nr:hypothetical protein [Alphaproteobacteria bacterium]
MFFLCQRTDTMPEQRALVNSDHVVALLPIAGGVRSKLYLDTGESWEIALGFPYAVALFRNEAEVVSGLPADRPRSQIAGAGAEPQTPPSGGFNNNPGLRRQPI